MDTLKVAIADDNENMLESLEKVIAQEDDFDVVGTATNGEEGLEILRQRKDVSLAFVDMVMPKLGGVDVLKQMKKEAPQHIHMTDLAMFLR